MPQFCFPDSKFYPNPLPRLYLLALHGPVYHEHSFVSCLCKQCQRAVRDHQARDGFAKRLALGGALLSRDDVVNTVHDLSWLCEKCRHHCTTAPHLKAGFKGRHVVNEGQLLEMEKDIAREDIMRTYKRPDLRTVQEQERFISCLPLHAKKPRKLTQDDVMTLLKDIPRVDQNTASEVKGTTAIESQSEEFISFHDFRRIVMEYRDHVISESRLLVKEEDETEKSKSSEPYVASQLTRTLLHRQLPEHQESQLKTSLLHQYLHQIAPCDPGKTLSQVPTSIVGNTHLLRYSEYDKELGWDGACAIRHQGKGSFVKKQKVPQKNVS